MPPKLIIEIVGNTNGLERSLGKARNAVGGLAISFGGLVKSVVVIEGVEKAIQGLSDAVHAGISEFKESSQNQAQTAAALKSTGSIAGVTADQIHALSLELSNLSGQSDESIQSAENVLLSFTNIRNSLGKNNDIFTQATKTVVDFSARTGRDAPAAAVLLGKALQDPAKRVGILARAGVVLTASQTATLKAVEKSKGVLAAQKILLGDLAVRFQGAAAAAGKTLPGALNILKERFRDLAGEGIAKIASPLTAAANALAGFVVKLTEAHGATAKLHVLTDGLKNLGQSIFTAVRDQIQSIDFGALFDGAKGIVRSVVDGVRKQFDAINWADVEASIRGAAGRAAEKVRSAFESVNWPQVLKTAGHAVGSALVAALNGLRTVISRVDWNKVGKAIVDGLVIAIAAVAKFLASVDWSKVVRALGRALSAALNAARDIFAGIGGEIGHLLLAAIEKGLAAAGKQLEATGLKLALAIIEPFTHLPAFLGSSFRDLKTSMQKQLQDLGDAGQSFAQTAGQKITSGLIEGLQAQQQQIVNWFASVTALATNAINAGGAANSLSDASSSGAPAAGTTTTTAATSPLKPVASDLLGSKTKRKGITADQRNTFFDNALSRMLDRVQDIPTIKGQIAKLQQISGLISARIKATKDVTRKLTLEDDLLNVARQIKSDRATLGQNLLDALSLNLTEAQATKSQQDDLKALAALNKALEQRVREEGKTTALEQQLFDVRQQRRAALAQIAQNRADARNAEQFKKIGLTGTGDALVPGVKSLKAQLGSVAKALSGSFLDTSKTRSLISHIRQVLSGGLGAVGRDVRDKIKGILDDIDQQLKNHAGDQTKFRHISSQKLVDSLGLKLTPDQFRRARAVFAGVGAGSTVANPSHQFAAAGAGGGLVINGDIHLHGVQDLRKMEDQALKRAKSRPRVRRGTQ